MTCCSTTAEGSRGNNCLNGARDALIQPFSPGTDTSTHGPSISSASLVLVLYFSKFEICIPHLMYTCIPHLSHLSARTLGIILMMSERCWRCRVSQSVQALPLKLAYTFTTKHLQLLWERTVCICSRMCGESRLFQGK